MQELDVQTIFGVLLRKCKLIILFTIIGALLFGAYTRFFVAETYKSEFEMYVISYRDQNSTTAQGISSSQLMAAQDLVNEYIVVMDNDRVLQSVANSLQKRGYTMTTKALRSVLKLSAVNSTAMLRVSAVTTDPALSQAICQAVSEVAPGQFADIMKLSSVEVMAPPQKGVKNGPSLVRNTALGAIIGLVLSAAIIIVLFMLDNTVKDERDLRRRMNNIPVLGMVPSFQRKTKKGGHRHA